MIFDNSVIVDIEATGGIPQISRIIEIGIVVFVLQVLKKGIKAFR